MFRGIFFAAALLLFPLLAVSVQAPNAPPRKDVGAETESKIPFKKTDESGAGLVFRVIGGFIVVMLLGIGSVYVLKRYFPSIHRSAFNEGGRIKVVEMRRLTPKVTLFLLEVDGANVLLGQSGDRLVALHETTKSAAGQSSSHGDS